MAPKKIYVGIQNFKFACTKICGYLKVVGTCSQIKILWVLKFVGIQNLWMPKIYLYSLFAGLRFVGTQKIVGSQICWYSYSFIGTPILGHFHLWVLIICGYIKFVMIQNSR